MAHRALMVRLETLASALPTVAREAAPLIEAQGRHDLTTARGNIPWFKGPMKGSSDIPFTAKAAGAGVRIRGVDWAIKRAFDRDYVTGWMAIVKKVARAAMKGKR
jgi:hypothetical protein